MRSRRYYAVRTAVRWAIWGPVGIGVYVLLLAALMAPTLERTP